MGCEQTNLAARALSAMLAAGTLPESARIELLRGAAAHEASYPEFCVDVTRQRSRSRDARFSPLAPEWGTIRARKRGWLDEDAFADAYYRGLVEEEAERAFRALHLVGRHAGGTVRLLCFCPDGVFCHTHLLIAYATTRFHAKFATPYNYTTY